MNNEKNQVNNEPLLDAFERLGLALKKAKEEELRQTESDKPLDFMDKLNKLFNTISKGLYIFFSGTMMCFLIYLLYKIIVVMHHYYYLL